MDSHRLRLFFSLELLLLAAESPDTAFDAVVGEFIEEVFRVLREVLMDDLGDFPVGRVFGVEGLAGQAVDVFDVVVFDALVESFGPDEAGCSGEEDLHGGWVVRPVLGDAYGCVLGGSGAWKWDEVEGSGWHFLGRQM